MFVTNNTLVLQQERLQRVTFRVVQIVIAITVRHRTTTVVKLVVAIPRVPSNVVVIIMVIMVSIVRRQIHVRQVYVLRPVHRRVAVPVHLYEVVAQAVEVHHQVYLEAAEDRKIFLSRTKFLYNSLYVDKLQN